MIRLAQISDFHWTHLTANPFKLLSKRAVGIANWLLHRKADFSEAPLLALAPLLKKLAVDRVLLGGDLTSTALESEFRAAQDFAERLSAPWIAIPGNHDHYTLASYFTQRFYRHFANAGAEGPFSLRRDGLEAHRLGTGWWLIALDTALPSLTSRGRFSPALERRLHELLAWIPQSDAVVLFNHYPFFCNDLHSRSLARAGALEAIVQGDRRIRAYLHGHTHRHVLADLQPSGYPVVLDGGCVGFANRASWNLLTLDERSLTVDVYRWDGRAWGVEQTVRMPWSR